MLRQRERNRKRGQTASRLLGHASEAQLTREAYVTSDAQEKWSQERTGSMHGKCAELLCAKSRCAEETAAMKTTLTNETHEGERQARR